MPERVKFLDSDLLDRLLDADFLETFDFVVSNPPYVGREEVDKVQREVREHEPLLAWGGLERGDEIYARLFPQAARALKPGGYVVVEIGYNMRDRILALLGVGAAVSPAGSRTEALYRPVQGEGPEPADRQSQGGAEESVARTAAGWSHIEVHPDLAGIPRVVIAKRRP
jgi:methylase of polypeptide subunit release factors